MKQEKKIPPANLDFDNTATAFRHLSDEQLRKVYAIFGLMNQNWLVKIGTFSLKLAFDLHLPVKYLVEQTIFRQFCGGESIDDCQKTIDKLAASGIGTILDYSVEGEDSEKDFDATTDEILRTIKKSAEEPDKIPFAVFKVTGIGAFGILQKFQTDPASLSPDETAAFERIRQRVQKISSYAHAHNVRLFFDAEESWIQQAIDGLCYEMMEQFNGGENVIIYNTFQFYLRASYENLVAITEKGRANNFKIGAKLVRGAYMEKERDRAEDMNYPDPIQPDKPATDADFNRGMLYALDNLNIFAVCLGTHNEASCKLCIHEMAQRGIDAKDNRIYFAQLLGMSDNISYNLAAAGYNVAKYVPYGPVESVMPYLIRRAEENTSVAGQSSREFLLIKKEVERRKKERQKQ